MTIMYSKPFIDQNTPHLTREVAKLKSLGLTPKMHVILVGNHAASLVYVQNKKKFCELVGAEFVLIHLSENVSEKDFLEAVDSANNDPTCTGCFVQLPIPKHLKHIDTTTLINPLKDVDGFGPTSILSLYKGKGQALIPCTPKGVVSLLKYYDIDFRNKDIVMIGRSLIVGRPLFHLLNDYDATVTLCHSKTPQIKKHTLNADIIISAAGLPLFITQDYIRKDKTQVLIDIGICYDKENNICGDMDFTNLKDHVAAITPVPKGIGPMTIFSLIENLIEATHNQIKQRNV